MRLLTSPPLTLGVITEEGAERLQEPELGENWSKPVSFGQDRLLQPEINNSCGCLNKI